MAPRIQELQLFRLQQESKNVGPVTNERENSSRKNAHEKRKITSSSTSEQSPAKRHKNAPQDLERKNENDKVQAKNSEASDAAQLDEDKAEGGSNKETKDKSSKKSVPFDDQCTAFISNLSLQACSVAIYFCNSFMSKTFLVLYKILISAGNQ